MTNVETKTQASTLSAAVAGVALWALSTYVFKSGMPQGVESLVYLAVPAVLAGAAGYLAPHTHRPDLAPAPAQRPDLVEQHNDPSLTGTDRGPAA